jgi:hypothetical protein
LKIKIHFLKKEKLNLTSILKRDGGEDMRGNC